MLRLIDSFWRAAAYCLHPRVIVLSLLPLALMVALSLVLGWLFWQDAIDAVRGMLESADWLVAAWAWLQRVGAGGLKSVVAPLVMIFAVTPLLVMVTLLGVALLMTPALTALVAQRRFAALERRGGSNFWQGVLLALGSTLAALAATLVSMPLWLVPPLVLVLPPLIWGWLTYRVMSFDVLAAHASRDERVALVRRHRSTLLLMGIVTGFLGAAPGVVWASGALFAAAFVILVPLAIWIYTLVFAFSSMWFAHFCLDALQAQRAAARAPHDATPGAGPVRGATTPGEVVDVSARVVSEYESRTPGAG
jgi:hypothetical protein